jgi:hypothetical protein
VEVVAETRVDVVEVADAAVVVDVLVGAEVDVEVDVELVDVVVVVAASASIVVASELAAVATSLPTPIMPLYVTSC